MTAVVETLPRRQRELLAREVVVRAFWLASRFGREAARRGDAVLATDNRKLLDQIAHWSADLGLARRAAAARDAIDAQIRRARAARPAPGSDLEGWLRLWNPWWTA